MTTEGFVKLPRSMLEWGWLDDGNTLKVYLVLLLSANWKDGEWHGIKVRRGQLITSRDHLATKCKLSVRQVRTAIEHLKSTNEIAVETTSQFSIITLLNYDYEEKNAVQTTNDRPAADQQTTNRRPTDDQLPTTIEERKEVKEEKELKEREEASPSPIVSPVSSITRDELIQSYGSENVSLYESKLAAWKLKKGITESFNDLETIAKWLAEDNVQKGGSFSMDSVMQRIISRYKT